MICGDNYNMIRLGIDTANHLQHTSSDTVIQIKCHVIHTEEKKS